MFSWALEKDRDALIWRLAGIHDGMAPLKELEARRPNPPCPCFLSALWIPVAKSGGKIKEDMKDGATWGRGLRRVGRLAPPSDLVLRDTGDSLHSSRGKARSQAVSLSPWWWSNRSASRCGRWLHSCLLHASGHTGKPRTLEKVSASLVKPVERTQHLMSFLEWGFLWPGKMKWSIHCSKKKKKTQKRDALSTNADMNKVFSKVSLKRKAYGSKVNLKRNYHLLFQSSFCIPTVYIVFSRFHTVGGTWGCQTPTFPYDEEQRVTWQL